MPVKGTVTRHVMDRRRRVRRLWVDGFTLREQSDMLGVNRHVLWDDWKALGLNGRRRPGHSEFMKRKRRQG